MLWRLQWSEEALRIAEGGRDTWPAAETTAFASIWILTSNHVDSVQFLSGLYEVSEWDGGRRNAVFPAYVEDVWLF
jgi:hypothetical protein